MPPRLAIFLECLLSFGVPLAWGLWELYLLRRRRPPGDGHFIVPPLPLPPEGGAARPVRPRQIVREDA